MSPLPIKMFPRSPGGAVAFILGFILVNPVIGQSADILLADFEGDTYGTWKTTGEAFGPGPAKGRLPGQMAVDGFKGKGLVNSFFKGDDSTGTLTSPPFKIERKHIAFLIGGGRHPGKACVNLLVDGKVVRTATGPNGNAGGSEALATESWDVTEFLGKEATIQIVDEVKGGWGHINIDHIVQTDKRPPGLLTNAGVDIQSTGRFLHLPIKTGAPKRVVSLLVDGEQVVRNDIELAPGEPDWWAPMDISAYKGRKLFLVVDKLPEDSKALQTLSVSDTLKDTATVYKEPLRNQFHFSPRKGWNNDPNGLVFFNNEYHLFFQHNPYGWDWGNMHWGHAVSKDLVHWEELGDKLAPDAMGPMFSGSAVVDWNNSSGLGKDGKPPLILFYTAAGNPTVQCLAYSQDGRTFHKYPPNPILKEITGGNRDPKVIWHEPTKQWVMTLYVEVNKVHTIQFFTSKNLTAWKFASKVDGFFECPDLFELPLDGDPVRKKWVLTAASSEYVVGSFDGKEFKPETGKLPGHKGKGFYAAQTFSDIPQTDGRRIQIGWFQTPSPGQPFNQAMTIPLEMGLVSTKAGPRLTWTPVRELADLRAKGIQPKVGQINPGAPNPLADISGELLEIRAEFTPSPDSETVFKVRGATIAYDAKKAELVINGHRASAPLINGKQRLIIFCDRNALEIFASDGLTYVPMHFAPKVENLSASLEVRNGSCDFSSLEAFVLKSAWVQK